jgi:uncharacterized membrane protein YphA (DoxX/SURF4 family)
MKLTISRDSRVVPSQTRTVSNNRRISKSGIALWVVQSLLGALFLFAGSVKFTIPAEMLESGPIPLPLAFIYFIGVCEVLGGLGLILPGASRILPGLTPLAACGLVIIMIGATCITAVGGDGAGAMFPAVVGCLCATVAYGRLCVAPQVSRSAHRSASVAMVPNTSSTYDLASAA